ncbi:MAG: hypothetical protein WBH21_11070 [Vibrio anguillarum]
MPVASKPDLKSTGNDDARINPDVAQYQPNYGPDASQQQSNYGPDVTQQQVKFTQG